MNEKKDAFTEGTERLTALLGWWGGSTAGGAALDGLQQFASEMQSAYGKTYSSQMDALFTINDRLTRSFLDLLRSRRPQDVLAVEMEILSTFLDSASLQAKRWAELTQRIQDWSGIIASDAAGNLSRDSRQTASAHRQVEPRGSAAKVASG